MPDLSAGVQSIFVSCSKTKRAKSGESKSDHVYVLCCALHAVGFARPSGPPRGVHGVRSPLFAFAYTGMYLLGRPLSEHDVQKQAERLHPSADSINLSQTSHELRPNDQHRQHNTFPLAFGCMYNHHPSLCYFRHAMQPKIHSAPFCPPISYRREAKSSMSSTAEQRRREKKKKGKQKRPTQHIPSSSVQLTRTASLDPSRQSIRNIRGIAVCCDTQAEISSSHASRIVNPRRLVVFAHIVASSLLHSLHQSVTATADVQSAGRAVLDHLCDGGFGTGVLNAAVGSIIAGALAVVGLPGYMLVRLLELGVWRQPT